MSANAQKLHVWPVFVVALGLLGVGFYAALGGNEEVAREQRGPAEAFVPTVRAVPVLEAAPSTHQLELGDDASSYRLELLQEQQRGEHQVRTRLALTVRETARESVEGNRRFMRSYDGVDLRVGFASETSQQVQELVGTANHRVTIKPTGEALSVELMSADAPQLRPVLELLEQAIALTMPRLPREPVRTEETWSWSIPATASSVEGESVAGKIAVTARVLGATNEGVLLQLELSGGMALDVSTVEGSQHAANATGTGRGLVLWDVALRRVVWSEIRWEQQEEVAGSKIDTRTFLRRLSE